MVGRAGAAAVVGLCCLLSGCSSSDPPPSTPTATTGTPDASSAAPPTTGVPSEATTPVFAAQHTPEGASAFVQFWFQTLEESWATMNSAPLRALSGDECLTCANFADTIDNIASEGGRLEGGDTTVSNAQPSALLTDGSSVVNALVSFAQQTVVNADGSREVLGAEQSNATLIFTLAWNDSEWEMSKAQVLA